ncbi:MAG: tRNA (N6-isopentenyl adenosine(37)-C2)-methylthiotransferase MiaB [Roseburia sp.]|nr:tRNA (N6-isopentenyl adenosine(37)-C2)-methylthiotransferase MiaB [Anaeroplasma bactoclasticum]MCM1195456.1 tRNA (N6-isopentenyl adenosine(37)-C2)-methylthiotransferase MiaB [Roseburia sp.]MCM1555935.1 tRNA (N6-isopentenyl adenosine(37)-C2)-methylthiotransferase MiaB [Anaeroplasma bactoclasticum]
MKNIKLALPSLKDARMRKNKTIQTVRYTLEEKYKNLGVNKTYAIFTYGCQGNEADSEVMAGILEQIGYTKSKDPMSADLVILNTCAIRENAEQRIWGVLGQLKGKKRENPDMLVGIAGCMPQEENATNKILESYSFIDLVIGTHNKNHLPKLLYEAYMSKAKVVEVISSEGEILEDAPKIRESHHKAWVNIMYGCDEFCTYCIVPYTRGRERSRAKEDIIKEVLELVSLGYVEITLLGQNVNAYGKDLEGDYTFGDLLYDLDKTGIKRIRYTTSHPKDLDEKTMQAMKDCKSVMPQLHLPVQSGDDEILRRMNRKYTYDEYMKKVNRLKELVPDIALTTDIIVGFPNETKEQFENTIKLVLNAKFEGAFTFIYSKREGTPAASMPDEVTDALKHRRLEELNRYINQGYLEGHKRFLNQVVEVLVDGPSKNGDGMMCGYTPHLKLTHFKCDDLSLIGKLVKVKITEAKTWFMIGELCE